MAHLSMPSSVEGSLISPHHLQVNIFLRTELRSQKDLCANPMPTPYYVTYRNAHLLEASVSLSVRWE